MSEDAKRIYEGLFLFPQSAAGNLQGALDHLTELLQRAQADVVSLSKWDERRLAYEIKGNKRGVYFLAYFRVEPTRLSGLERDCNLSEQLLRSMVTRADHLPSETIEAAEGRDKLADEIRLRGEEAESGTGTPTARVETAPAATAVAEPKKADTAPGVSGDTEE